MVYDGRSLHLVDVDEGYAPYVPIKRRIVDEAEIDAWETFLFYPDSPRSLYAEYAVVQVSVSFVRIAVLNDNTTNEATQYPQFDALVRVLQG